MYIRGCEQDVGIHSSRKLDIITPIKDVLLVCDPVTPLHPGHSVVNMFEKGPPSTCLSASLLSVCFGPRGPSTFNNLRLGKFCSLLHYRESINQSINGEKGKDCMKFRPYHLLVKGKKVLA